LSAAQGWGAFLGGIALAGFAFFAFHRLDLLLGGMSAAAAVSLASLLAGWGVGAGLVRQWWRPRRRGRRVLAAGGLALWAWCFARAGMSGSAGGAALLVMGGVVPLAVLLEPLAADRRGRLLVLAGACAGFVALCAGLAATLSAGGAMLAFGVAGMLAAGVASPPAGQAPASGALRPGAPFVLAAFGIVAVALVRTYSYGTGWFAYAAAELALALCVGLILRELVTRSPAARGFASVAPQALVLLAVVVLLGSCFLLYPYVVCSEPATLQSGRGLLTAHRTFPLWLFAAALAFAVPPGSAGRRTGSSFLAAGAGAAAVLLLPARLSPMWHYAAAASLCVAALAPECARVAARRRPGPRYGPFSIAALILALAAVGWTCYGKPWVGWRWLKRTLVWYSRDVKGRLNACPSVGRPTAGTGDVAIARVRYGGWGLSAEAAAGGETGRFVCGNLVASSRGLDGGAVRLTVALALAAQGPRERIGVIEPALEETAAGMAVLAPEAKVTWLSSRVREASPSGPAGLDAIVCGPGPLSWARSPLSIVSIERLAALRLALKGGGVVALWLPTRTISPRQFRRVLSTVHAVFSEGKVFVFGDELVLVCGERVRLDWGRLEAFLRGPRGRRYLGEGGFWDARQVVACYAGDLAQMLAEAQSARPYSLRFPSRPPVLARDLAEQSRADVLALLVQHRLDAGDWPSELLIFESESQKELALERLGALRDAQTESLMEAIGEIVRSSDAPSEALRGLVSALEGPGMDLGVFAPQAESHRLKLAIALQKLGLPAESLRLLKGGDWPARDMFAVWYWRGRGLEAMGQPREAIAAYEAALRKAPGSAEALLRLAGAALVELSFLYGQMKRYRQAARLAERALEICPDDRTAQDLFYLYSRQANGSREGGG